MSRRDSMLSDVIDLAARLPWKVGVGLAIGSFIVLHALSTGALQPHSAPKNVAALGSQAGIGFISIVTYLMQFIIPPAFVVGAGISYFRRRLGDGALAQVASGGREVIAAKSYTDFELLVGAALRNAGYRVVNQTLPGPDGGVDLVVEKDRKRVLVQCKHWQTKSVGVSVIRELLGVLASRHADGAMVVTSGRFTDEAKEFAVRTGVELFDGARLQKLIQSGPNRPVETPRKSPPAMAPPNKASTATSPICPKCGGAMVRRTAHQGVHEGKDFWACRGYPGCRGIVDIPM